MNKEQILAEIKNLEAQTKSLREKLEVAEKNNNLAEFPENVLGIIREWGGLCAYIGIIVILQNGELRSIACALNQKDFDGSKWTNLDELKTLSNMRIDVLSEEQIEKLFHRPDL